MVEEAWAAVASLDDYNSERRWRAILPRTVAGSILAEILKSVGIGWLFLVAMGALATLALALANGGSVTAYPGLLTIGLLASPGLVLLLAGLLVEEDDGQR